MELGDVIGFSGGIKKQEGVLSDNGKSIVLWRNFTNRLEEMHWITPEELEKLKNEREQVDAPLSPYKIQPEYQGKFLWLSGHPGAGKSTTAQFLGRNLGYVYYEGDCFLSHCNPYIPCDEKLNSSKQQMHQAALKVISKERIDAVSSGMKYYTAFFKGQKVDSKDGIHLYEGMCKAIAAERKRLGGDWVVAHTVPTRDFRDVIKRILGSELILVILIMTKDAIMERIQARRGEKVDVMLPFYDMYEPAGENEVRVINVTITPNMTPEDVSLKVIEQVKVLHSGSKSL